jgi:endonuclease YncB( thermonuclease family)
LIDCSREGRPRIKSGVTIRRQDAVTMTPIDRDRDVYGRLLRNVRVNGRDVGETLIAEGVARAYAGGRRSWC